MGLALLGLLGAALAGVVRWTGAFQGYDEAAQGATTNGRTVKVRFNERAATRLKVDVKRLTAGRVTFVVENRGRRAHRLVVVKSNRRKRNLPLANGKVRPVGRVGRVQVGPGRSGTLVVDLAEGKHFLIGNLRGHAGKGEIVRLRVLAPAAAPPAPTPTPAPSSAGRSLFRSTCAICHTLADAGTTGTIGPNLDRLGPSAATVARQVANGGGGMPAFAGLLSPAQINEIALYVAAAASR